MFAWAPYISLIAEFIIFFYSDNCYLSISTRQHLVQLFRKTIWCLTAWAQALTIEFTEYVYMCVYMYIYLHKGTYWSPTHTRKVCRSWLDLPVLHPWLWDEVSTRPSGFHLTHLNQLALTLLPGWPCLLRGAVSQPQCNSLRFSFPSFENNAVTRPTSQTVMKGKWVHTQST